MGTINVSTLEEIFNLTETIQEEIRSLKPFDMSFDEVNDFIDMVKARAEEIDHKLHVIRSINFKFNAPPWREVIPPVYKEVVRDFRERLEWTDCWLADIFNSVIQELNNEGYEIKCEKDERTIDRILRSLLDADPAMDRNDTHITLV